jgi:hypothetical protein
MGPVLQPESNLQARPACHHVRDLYFRILKEQQRASPERYPEFLAGDVQEAVGSALPHVLDVTRFLGRLGKPVHFHLHDGHPLIPGLRDHFSFLTRLPIPFSYQGRRSLSTMYGPGGLASIVSTAIEACPPQGVSFTVEVHQVEGRLPLADAAWLFPHWRDTTNAERMNYWLSVLSANGMLISQNADHNPRLTSRDGPI